MEKHLWEFLLKLSNWRYYMVYMKDYTSKKTQKESIIEEVIDKLSIIRFLVEDVKKHIVIKGIKNTEKVSIARILGHIEEGIMGINEKIKLLF